MRFVISLAQVLSLRTPESSPHLVEQRPISAEHKRRAVQKLEQFNMAQVFASAEGEGALQNSLQ